MEEDVKEFNEKLDLEMDPELRVHDLISELGELSKEILKTKDYGDSEYEVNEDIEDEFGDVYYCILSLAAELGVDPEEALRSSLEKYRKRFEEKDSVGSGN
ncbi:MAG: MazG nucleotide pyrophosphohydrolase domain-containing protein [Candidatus Nanohaloarchaea archaeon]